MLANEEKPKLNKAQLDKKKKIPQVTFKLWSF